jgi:WD40 repeat protein
MKRLLPLLCIVLAAGCERHSPTTDGQGAPQTTRSREAEPPSPPPRVRKLPPSTTIGWVSFSPDGRHVYIRYTLPPGYAAGPDFTHLRVFDARTGAEERSSTEPFAFPAAFTPDGRLMFCLDRSDQDGTVTLRRADGGAVVRTFHDPKMPITRLVVPPDGKTLLTGDDPGRVLVWDVGSGKLRHTLSTYGPIANLVVSADGQRAMTTLQFPDNHGRSIAKVWDQSRGALLRSLELPQGHQRTLAICPDGATALTETWLENPDHLPVKTKYRLVLWDLETGKVVKTFAERQGGASGGVPGVYKSIPVSRGWQEALDRG